LKPPEVILEVFLCLSKIILPQSVVQLAWSVCGGYLVGDTEVSYLISFSIKP